MWRKTLILLAASIALATAARAQDLRVAVAAFPTSLGVPYTGISQPSSELWLSVFDALTVLDWSKEAKPGLALSWENKTATVWTFHLRPGVTFHNGKSFTAQDVVEVFKLLKSPEGSGYLIAAETQNIVDVRAKDSLTLEIETRTPDAILPKRLSIIMIIEPDHWRNVGRDGFARKPIGTGPYRLISWGGGDKDATLEAFADSWRPAKSIKRLQYRVILEHTSRLQALVSQQVDMVTGLQVDDVEDLRAGGLQVTVQQNPQIKSLALRNLKHGASPLKDVRVRRALNYAVDKDAIARVMMQGYVEAIGQGAPPGITGHNPDVKPYAYDPPKARTLLAEAGYAKGLKLLFSVVTTTGTPDAVMYQKVAQDLAAVGVSVDLQTTTFADYQSRYTFGNWGDVDAFSQIWNNAAFQDPIRAVEYFSCLKINPFFCEQDLVSDITKINAEIEPAKRESLLRNYMARIHDAAPAIWLTNSLYVTGYQPRVTHFEMLPSGVTFEKLEVKRP